MSNMMPVSYLGMMGNYLTLFVCGLLVKNYSHLLLISKTITGYFVWPKTKFSDSPLKVIRKSRGSTVRLPMSLLLGNSTVSNVTTTVFETGHSIK